MRAAVDLGRPDAIVHAGALADADTCEREPGLAALLNSDAPRELARLSRVLGLRFVSISTDLVFDGRSAWSDEAVEARPLLVYGRTKLDGERAILGELPDAVVFRVALVHGCGFGTRSTASETVASALATGASPRLFTDQYRTSIDPESVASAIAAALAGRGRGPLPSGGPERLSRLELGLRAARVLGLDERRLVPLRQAEIPLPVPRPLDASMDSRRARRELGWSARPIRIAAFASSVVASIAIVFPLRRPVCARRSWIQVNTSRWVSKSISRRVREIVECSGARSSNPSPRKLRTPSESAARHAIPRSESRPSKYPTSKSRK